MITIRKHTKFQRKGHSLKETYELRMSLRSHYSLTFSIDRFMFTVSSFYLLKYSCFLIALIISNQLVSYVLRVLYVIDV